MQAHFKPLCVCHLLKSHWPRQIPWQSPESGLGEVNPLPTGWGRGMAVSYYCKAQTNRDDNSVYHAGREWSRVRSGKGPRGHRLQKLRPQEGRGGAHVTQQMLGRAGHPGLWFGSASQEKLRGAGQGATEEQMDSALKRISLCLYSLFWNLGL